MNNDLTCRKGKKLILDKILQKALFFRKPSVNIKYVPLATARPMDNNSETQRNIAIFFYQ